MNPNQTNQNAQTATPAPVPVPVPVTTPTETAKQLPPIEQIKLDALKEIARGLKLKVGGTKAELHKRITDHYAAPAPVVTPAVQEPVKQEPANPATAKQLPPVEQTKLNDLRELARNLKIKTAGNKGELYQRILDHYAGKPVPAFGGRKATEPLKPVAVPGTN